ncbi:hypothetical protein ACI65C_013117 [Semiaphis heraclei]
MGREGIRSVFRNPTRNRSLVFGALLSRPGDRNELEEAAGGVREEFSFLCERCTSLESSSRAIGTRARRAPLVAAVSVTPTRTLKIRERATRSLRVGSYRYPQQVSERGGSGSGRRRSVGGAGDTPAVARAPGLRTGSLEAVAGSSPSADRGTTELRSLVASRPAVRLGVGSPSPGGPAAAPSAA